ncbi:NADH-quinone oxidoreductase subunit D [Egibacter rhizosphaerae]|uniref:NADH-quinone oxidoreductase subunit D n=1 Tax=Egibacter rhizosphaerae TaxID=1670831 RepID=A0A411YGJ3_9ACTN|nr:NADH-quinone oxidoreductase subunit D [Egibacter rhizosphaerae]QBI20360.1 NADH-quinone oxidoreductase subunit D [Egibacter rhizosphaerae]
MTDTHGESGPDRTREGPVWQGEEQPGSLARTGESDYLVVGGEWQDLPEAVEDDTMVINMGPQHPSTHGVLRLVLTLDGETVLSNDPVIGYLHTGIEKNTEYRPWVQGVTFVTRMDYLSPLFNELGYCLATERILGIEEEVPERAQAIRVILTELNRVSSHMVWLATGGMELGSTTAMIFGFRERESVLDIFEHVTGLRMNHGFIRPGGLANDVPDTFDARVRQVISELRQRIDEIEDLLTKNPIWIERNKGVGIMDAETCLDYGATGPVLRSAGIAHDLRKAQPYCGIEQYDFEVPITDTADSYGRYLIRVQEVRESLSIVEQALDRLPGGRVMVDDDKIAWPAQLGLGPDGLGNTEEYISKIMGQSMEALIHHFKIVTEGFTAPPGQAYAAVESPRGELGYHITSNGTNKPYRVRVRDPSFIHIGALDPLSRGLGVADIIVAVASVDPVMGGVDR